MTDPAREEQQSPPVPNNAASAVPSSDLAHDDAPLPVTPLPGVLGRIAAQLGQLPREGLAIAFVVAMAAATLLPNIGSMGFFDCWETHYGEVAREMVMRDDYVYPYWKSDYFFSKPVLIFWLMAGGFNLVGANHREGPLPVLTEWSARAPVALLALFAVFMIYLAVRHTMGRTQGILAAAVLATTPFWVMVARQAITDMPYVALSTAALCCFMLAAFSDSYRASRWFARVSPWFLGAFALATLPQYWIIVRSVVWLNGFPFAVRIGVFAGLVALLGAVGFWLHKRGRDSAMLAFYVLVALATLAKGLGGFMLPGLVILCYLLVTWDWALLRRIQIMTGALLFILVAFPWYVVMSLFTGKDDEQKMFYQRFWIHDHLNRLAAGVHGEKGDFDYFVRQLGYGTLTWAAVMPIAFFDALRKPLRGMDTPKEKARVFVVVWALVYFVFFTAMQTKFHHYILPAVPPLAILAGLWLADLWESGKVPSALTLAALFGITMLVALDGVRQPWSFIDLFTYHYISYKPDYYFPSNIFPYDAWIAALTGLGMLVVLTTALYGHAGNMASRLAGSHLVNRLVRFGVELGVDAGHGLARLVGGTPGRGFVLTFAGTGFALALFMTQVYLLELAPHWSQRYLFDTYWTDRKPGEPILAYLMNWRGETFYALNTDQQIKDNAGLKGPIKGPGRKYIVVESNRYAGLQSALGDLKSKAEIIDRSNSKWWLVRLNEGAPEEPPKPAAPASQKAD